MRGVKVWMAAAALLWLLVTPAQASVIPDSFPDGLSECLFSRLM